MLEKEVASIIASVDDLEFISIDAEANAGIDDKLVKRFDEFINSSCQVGIKTFNQIYSMEVRLVGYRIYQARRFEFCGKIVR